MGKDLQPPLNPSYRSFFFWCEADGRPGDYLSAPLTDTCSNPKLFYIFIPCTCTISLHPITDFLCSHSRQRSKKESHLVLLATLHPLQRFCNTHSNMHNYTQKLSPQQPPGPRLIFPMLGYTPHRHTLAPMSNLAHPLLHPAPHCQLPVWGF